MEPPSGPVDAELVMPESARQWAVVELAKRGPASDPILDILTRNSELADLTKERMRQLRVWEE